MPRLIHLCGDTVWTEIGQKLNKLFYIDDMVIDHIHHETKPGVEKDEVSKIVNSPEAYRLDYFNYFIWDKFNKETDLIKCRAVARE